MSGTVETILALILLAPIAFNLYSRYATLRSDPAFSPKGWLRSRLIASPVRFLAVVFWCASWDVRHSEFVKSPLELLAFWLLPLLSVGISQWAAYWTDKSILRLKWSSFEIAALAFWSTVTQTGALLMAATAAELIYRGWWQGFLLLLAAGFVALVGTAKLRACEGLRPRPLRSGRLRGRAFQLARQMSVHLEEVSVVPAGKGHLTNAYGVGRSIAMTDNYGEFASGAQLDFVIGHELTHVARRHSLKKMAAAAALYGSLALIFFDLPPLAWQLRPVIDLLFLAGPAFAIWFISRRFEYAADRESVKFSGDPEAAIRALADLYQTTRVPVECSKILELFMTHPALYPRAAAIANANHMPLRKVREILELPP